MNNIYSAIVIMMIKCVKKKKKFWNRMTYFVLKDPRLARPALALKVSRGPYQRSAHLYAPSGVPAKKIEMCPDLTPLWVSGECRLNVARPG